MGNTVTISVRFPTDEKGMVGRECPQCQQYFKVTPGTGLPISTCSCPYCEYSGDSGDFFTKEQIEYAKSVAAREVLGPALAKLQRSLKQLETHSRGGLIQFKVKTGSINFPIKYYSEKDVETTVVCDNCGLVFAIYGVFARCPDCERLTSMSIFKNSLAVARKKLGLVDKIPADEQELIDATLADALSAGVAAFDGLGKQLRDDYPDSLPKNPRNLFQNLDALSAALQSSLNLSLEQIVGETNLKRMYLMFQVRHLWDHSFGEVDEDFIKKTQCDPSLLRKKYALNKPQVVAFLDQVEDAGIKVREALNGIKKWTS